MGKYRRYGQANMNDVVRDVKVCHKKYFNNIAFSDFIDLFKGKKIYEIRELEEELFKVIDKPALWEKFKADDKSYLATQQLLLEMSHEQLLITQLTYDKLYKEEPTFNKKYWTDFEGCFHIDYNRNFSKLYSEYDVKGVSLERISIMAHGKWVVFEFNGYSDDSDVREVSKASKTGFFNFGVIIFNKMSGSLFIQHVNPTDPRNHFKLSCVGKNFLCEKIPSKEQEDYFKKSLANDKRELKLKDNNVQYIRIGSAENFRNIEVARGVLTEYQRALTSVKDVKTDKGLNKKVKTHQARGLRIDYIESPVYDKYVPLTTLMRKTATERKEWQGGHHRSPIEHEVNGYFRTYKKTGKTVWVNGFTRGGKDGAIKEASKDKINTTVIKV